MSHVNDNLLSKAMGYKELYDISSTLGTVSVYPGDRQFSQKWMARLEGGSDYSLSALTLSSHAGTHLDAPAHLLKNGRTLDQYPIDRFIIPAHVISVDGVESIPPSTLIGQKTEKGEAILFQTNNSRQRVLQSPEFSEEFVYLSKEAAKRCVSLGSSLVGIDSLSVDKYGDPFLPVHHTLLENDILILEGIDLSGVPCGRYSLICLPLRVTGAEACPARAILVR